MKILFITANRLGDAVLSLGILSELLRRHPDAEMTVACGPLPAPLFTAIPVIERVIVLEKGKYARHWRNLWAQTVIIKWDVIVDLRQSLVSLLLPARQRLIWHKPKTRLHKVEELAALLKAMPVPAPRLWLSDAAVAKAAALLPDRPILALAPGANSIGKQWPVERFMELGRHLTAPDGLLPDAIIMILGDDADRLLIDDYFKKMSSSAQAEDPGKSGVLSPSGWPACAEDDNKNYKIINLAGQLPINVTAACLARASLYIGNDSGLTHLAAAGRVPTLALFGPGIAWKYRPWGDRAAYFSKADDPARDHDLCRDGDDAAALALMERLEVQDVVAAAAALWQKVQP